MRLTCSKTLLVRFSLWIASVAFALILPPDSWAQAGGAPAGARAAVNAEIFVQVRNQDGTAAPSGIHMRLELASGSSVYDCTTDGEGRCRFAPGGSGRYVARVKQFGYKETSVEIDLADAMQSYVTLELRPDSGTTVTDSPPGGHAISAAELAIPENARAEFQKGQSALKDHKLDESISHLRKAIKLYDAFPQAYTLLGTAYIEQENWKDAEKTLHRATALDDKASDAYIGLGTVFNKTKEYPRAEAALLRGLELQPEAPTGHYELAKTYWFLGRWKEADPHARTAVTAMPDAASAHLLLGNILLREENAPGALEQYHKYLFLDPLGSMAPAVREVVEKLEKTMRP